MNHNSDRVFKLPKGNFKDGLLKYNMLKLLTTLAMIFGGLYLVWGAYFGYFSKASLVDHNKSVYTMAFVESTKSSGYYYYEIATDRLDKIYDKIKDDNEYKELIDRAYEYTYEMVLAESISKEDYMKILELQKKYGLLTKNIFTGQKMPQNVLKGDCFPVIFEISNPDNHFIGDVGESETELRNFIMKTRKNNLLLMLLTPFIPILGFLWLFFSAKHTYKRQQAAEKNSKSST